MPALTARAQRAVAIDREVTELTAEVVRASVELAVEQHPPTDAGAERHHQDVAGTDGRAACRLADGRHIGVVVDDDRTVRRGRERLSKRRFADVGKIRRVAQFAVRIDETGGTDADRDRAGRQVLDDGGRRRDEGVHARVG